MTTFWQKLIFSKVLLLWSSVIYNHLDPSLEVTFNNKQINKKLNKRNYVEDNIMHDVTLLCFTAIVCIMAGMKKEPTTLEVKPL